MSLGCSALSSGRGDVATAEEKEMEVVVRKGQDKQKAELGMWKETERLTA